MVNRHKQLVDIYTTVKEVRRLSRYSLMQACTMQPVILAHIKLYPDKKNDDENYIIEHLQTLSYYMHCFKGKLMTVDMRDRYYISLEKLEYFLPRVIKKFESKEG